MLVEIEAFQNKGYIGDLTAIMETIKKRSAHSELLQTFLKSDTAQRIEAAVSMWDTKKQSQSLNPLLFNYQIEKEQPNESVTGYGLSYQSRPFDTLHKLTLDNEVQYHKR